jgi:hypothetical protein
MVLPVAVTAMMPIRVFDSAVLAATVAATIPLSPLLSGGAACYGLRHDSVYLVGSDGTGVDRHASGCRLDAIAAVIARATFAHDRIGPESDSIAAVIARADSAYDRVSPSDDSARPIRECAHIPDPRHGAQRDANATHPHDRAVEDADDAWSARVDSDAGTSGGAGDGRAAAGRRPEDAEAVEIDGDGSDGCDVDRRLVRAENSQIADQPITTAAFDLKWESGRLADCRHLRLRLRGQNQDRQHRVH